MGEKGLFWIILFVGLISISFLSSCSQEKSGSDPVTVSPVEESTPAITISGLQISDYRLIVDGLVDHPLSLTYESILRYPSVSDKLWLICPGVFENQNEWTGVRLTTILNEAGIKPGANTIKFSSSDGYSQELSTRDAQKEGVFLAYQVDGQVLPQNDGYPLRLVAKDQIGAVWVKYLAHIEVK